MIVILILYERLCCTTFHYCTALSRSLCTGVLLSPQEQRATQTSIFSFSFLDFGFDCELDFYSPRGPHTLTVNSHCTPHLSSSRLVSSYRPYHTVYYYYYHPSQCLRQPPNPFALACSAPEPLGAASTSLS